MAAITADVWRYPVALFLMWIPHGWQQNESQIVENYRDIAWVIGDEVYHRLLHCRPSGST